jgi:hypothetical protein
MPSKQLARIPARWRKAVLGFAVVCVAVAIMLMTDRQPSPAENQPRVETAIISVQAAAPVEAQPAPKPRAPRTTVKPATAVVGSKGSTAQPMTKAAADSPPSPRTEGAPATTATATAQGEPATIIGCLEFDDDTFRLKDTEGEDAPKARSWRSGFFKRSNARLEVVDTSNRLRLSTHVGHRVSLTGTLVEREMQARSVKMVADTCDN